MKFVEIFTMLCEQWLNPSRYLWIHIRLLNLKIKHFSKFKMTNDTLGHRIVYNLDFSRYLNIDFLIFTPYTMMFSYSVVCCIQVQLLDEINRDIMYESLHYKCIGVFRIPVYLFDTNQKTSQNRFTSNSYDSRIFTLR